MLKQQTIPVGDIDTIANAIDKQKVSFMLWGEIACHSEPWQIFPLTIFHSRKSGFFGFPESRHEPLGNAFDFPLDDFQRALKREKNDFRNEHFHLPVIDCELMRWRLEPMISRVFLLDTFTPFLKTSYIACHTGIDGEDRKIIDFYLNSTLSLENFTIDGNNIMARVGFWTQSSSNIDVDIILDQTTLLTGP